MSSDICQAAFIKEYNDKNREQFNPELFIRDDNAIIEELKKVILSCQKDSLFTIKVLGFTVIESYKQINDILFQYEEGLQDKGKGKKKDNQFKYINLRESDIKLMIIKYLIKIRDDEEIVDVLLCTPRIVDKYYFKISGNYYSAMYQIVDGSTYNNMTSSNSKNKNRAACITLKSFNPIRVYMNKLELDTVYHGRMLSHIFYCAAFTKSLSAIKYIFGKYGLNYGLQYLGVDCITITKYIPERNDHYYNFYKPDIDIYINVPKYIFDNDSIVQSIVSTIYKTITKDTVYEEMFSIKFWEEAIGYEFTSKLPREKGVSVLESLEFIYDKSTMESIKLPLECKETAYDIIRWMMREFDTLKSRDNQDLSFKKIRLPEYISSMYSMKMCNGIYRVSKKQKKDITLKDLRTIIMINPMYLLQNITKCKLIHYNNLVNDLDSITALEFTYKGIAGIGENSNSSVPLKLRFVHPSNMGRTDTASSHKSDPGMSGNLCPFTKLNNGYFSDYQEPNFWEQNFSNLMKEYRALTGMKQIFKMKKDFGDEISIEEENSLNESIEVVSRLMNPVRETINFEASAKKEAMKYFLEEGGMIYYEYLEVS